MWLFRRKLCPTLCGTCKHRPEMVIIQPPVKKGKCGKMEDTCHIITQQKNGDYLHHHYDGTMYPTRITFCFAYEEKQ